MTKKRKIGVLLIVFCMAFAVLLLIGNLVNGEKADVEPGFYSFFYQTIPSFLGNAVGIPINGAFGVIFSVVSGIIFLIISLKLFISDADTDSMFDGRFLTFLLSFIYITIVSSVMVDESLAATFLAHKFLCTIPLIFIVLAVILAFSKLFSENHCPANMRSLLAYLGFGLSAAAFSRVILFLKIERIVVLPAYFSELISKLVKATENNFLTVLLNFSIIGVLLFALLFFLFIFSGKRDCSTDYAALGFGVVLFWSYSPAKDYSVFSQGLKYWVLFIIALAICAFFAKANGDSPVKTFIGGIGFITVFQTLFYALVYFYDDVTPGVAKLIDGFAPFKSKVLGAAKDFFFNIIKDEELAEIANNFVIPIIVLIATVLLLWLPLKPTKKHDEEMPMIMGIATIVYLCGVILYNNGLIKAAVINVIAYIAIVAAFVVLLAGLLFSAFIKNYYVLGKVIYCIVISAVLTPIFSLFSLFIGILAVAIIGGVWICISMMSGGSGGRSQTDIAIDKMVNFADYLEKMETIHEAEKAGVSPILTGMAKDAVRENAKERDAALSQEFWDNL